MRSLFSTRSSSSTAASRLVATYPPKLIVARPRKSPRIRTMTAASPEKIAQNIKPDAEKQVMRGWLAGHQQQQQQNALAQGRRQQLTPCVFHAAGQAAWHGV
jgi:hypothetical protein